MRRLVVLNTRPHDQAAELSRLLREADLEVVEAPAIAIEPAWDPGELERVRQAIATGQFAWIVLPSQNAGRELVSALRASEAKLVCGSATAAALGLSPAVALDRFSANAALAALRPRLAPGERVLVPRAAEGRDELVQGLLAAGTEVLAPVAYATVPSEAARTRLRQGGIDVVALCSPSAVRSVSDALDARTRVVCLGEITANAARAAGLRVDAVAASTSMPALVAEIRGLAGVAA
jgi:uroporphyrinogen-III synthase